MADLEHRRRGEDRIGRWKAPDDSRRRQVNDNRCYGGGMYDAGGGREGWHRYGREGYGREDYGRDHYGDYGPNYSGGGYGPDYRSGLAGYGSVFGREGYGDGGPYGREGTEGRYRGRGPRGYMRSDERIREDVNDRLTDDIWIDASGIEVGVSNVAP